MKTNRDLKTSDEIDKHNINNSGGTAKALKPLLGWKLEGCKESHLPHRPR